MAAIGVRVRTGGYRRLKSPSGRVTSSRSNVTG
jgi:hypothetical protein